MSQPQARDAAGYEGRIPYLVRQMDDDLSNMLLEREYLGVMSRAYDDAIVKHRDALKVYRRLSRVAQLIIDRWS